MSKPEIKVTCFFTNEGESARQIIYRSFGIFLQEEIAQDGWKFAFLKPSHVRYP